MKFLRCFCFKNREKTQATVDAPVASTEISHIEDGEQASKLSALREQIKLAQTLQAAKPYPPVIDHVVGEVEIPIYESDGVAFRCNGKSQKLLVYDK